jgi:hypothetical protein
VALRVFGVASYCERERCPGSMRRLRPVRSRCEAPHQSGAHEVEHKRPLVRFSEGWGRARGAGDTADGEL